MLITKADGSEEEFKPQKLRTSLRKAGARKEEIDEIVTHIERTLNPGDRTQTIYQNAFRMLREHTNYSDPTAARYSLRRALFGLGPTGFPFEDFLARLFQAEGYTTQTGIYVKGKCTEHEIDLAAYKTEDSFVAEAKFHSRPGIKSDLQVALYSYARYMDLVSLPVCKQDTCGIKRLYVITNTKFTTTAKRYANCVGIELLSWNHPKGNTLQTRIEKARIYPVTALTSISGAQKTHLLKSGIILCRELLAHDELSRQLGLSGKKHEALIEEARALCGSHH